MHDSTPSMNDKKLPCQDACWNAAWTWIQRQHEVGFDDPAFNAELAIWLQADPANRVAYDKAAKIWAIAGLVSPVNELSPHAASSRPSSE